MKPHWLVKEWKEVARGITKLHIGIFSTERTAEDASEVPVALSPTWGAAHEILRWMKDNPQQEFERKAIYNLDAHATQRRLAATRSLTAGSREARKRAYVPA